MKANMKNGAVSAAGADCAGGACMVMEKALTALLDLKRRPVGIKFLATEADYEAAKAKEPAHGLPYCTAVAKAGDGSAYKMDVRHNRCAAASTALGMLPVSEYRLSGQMHVDFGVYRDLNVSGSVARDMVYCVEENYGVMMKPLCEYTDCPPDVVILILTAKWAMRFIQGYAYNFGQMKDIKMAGMCAICQECTSYPHVKDSPNISMLCSGTRCVGRWREDELGIGFPEKFLRGVIDGLWNTIDPMENRKSKERLMAELSKAGLKLPSVNMNRNYYSGAYGIPKE